MAAHGAHEGPIVEPLAARSQTCGCVASSIESGAITMSSQRSGSLSGLHAGFPSHMLELDIGAGVVSLRTVR